MLEIKYLCFDLSREHKLLESITDLFNSLGLLMSFGLDIKIRALLDLKLHKFLLAPV
jgi:hypothetical protein